MERLLHEFFAPNTWDVSGGRGVMRSAEDRLIIRQTPAVHEQVEQFFRDYQLAKPVGQNTSQP